MTKKTQRMRPPTAESSRQADEYRRHREVIEQLDRIDHSTHILDCRGLSPPPPCRRRCRSAPMTGLK